MSREFWLKGCVYCPAFFFGKYLSSVIPDAAFVIGWVVGATAIMVSLMIWPPVWRS